jgi:hypothetical protein
VIVQVVLPPEVIVAGVHCSADTVTGGVTVTAEVAEVLFSDAVTVTDWLDATVPAVAVKLAVVEPAATVTEAGTVSAVLLSETATLEPPVGAACDSVTVQVALPPETTVAGVHCSADTVTRGVMVTGEVAEVLFSEAVTVTDWLDATVPAVAVKLAVVEPAATVTEAGTGRAVLLDETATLEPPVGATCDNVIVQVVLPPEVIVAGVHCKVVTVICGVTVTGEVAEAPFSDAVTVTDWLDATVPAVAVKLAVVEPAATVTEVGTVSAVLLFETATLEPPVGAANDSVTVHVDPWPDVSVAGTHWSAETVGSTLIVPPVPETPI